MNRFLFVFIVLFCIGCNRSKMTNHPPSTILVNFELPSNTKNVKDKGNGWFTFEWEGKVFLAVKTSTSHGFPILTFTQIKD